MSLPTARRNNLIATRYKGVDVITAPNEHGQFILHDTKGVTLLKRDGEPFTYSSKIMAGIGKRIHEMARQQIFRVVKIG